MAAGLGAPPVRTTFPDASFHSDESSSAHRYPSGPGRGQSGGRTGQKENVEEGGRFWGRVGAGANTTFPFSRSILKETVDLVHARPFIPGATALLLRLMALLYAPWPFCQILFPCALVAPRPDPLPLPRPAIRHLLPGPPVSPDPRGMPKPLSHTFVNLVIPVSLSFQFIPLQKPTVDRR